MASLVLLRITTDVAHLQTVPNIPFKGTFGFVSGTVTDGLVKSHESSSRMPDAIIVGEPAEAKGVSHSHEKLEFPFWLMDQRELETLTTRLAMVQGEIVSLLSPAPFMPNAH